MTSQAQFYAALGSAPAAVALFTQLRWPDGVICPHCEGRDIGGHGSYWRDPDLPRYHCKTCRRTFLLTTGTLIARSRVPLMTWLRAAWLICLGESARRCARETGLHYARAYALLWRMIEAALSLEADRQLFGEVEADEIYIRSGHKGRKPSSATTGSATTGSATTGSATTGSATTGSGESSERHSRRRGLRHGPGRGHADKDRPVVFVQLQRKGVVNQGVVNQGVVNQGVVNVEAAAGVDQETVKRVFRERVEPESQLYTDSARCYLVLKEEGYALEQVNHSQKEFVRGERHEIHENGAEGEISLLRLFLAHHRGIAQSNLPSYLKLYQFGRNYRQLTAWQQSQLLLQTLLGNGPALRSLLPPQWSHSINECQVGCYTSSE